MQITEALQLIESDNAMVLHSPLEWPGPDYALKNLAAKVKWLQERVERSVPPKPLEDVLAVWQRFEAAGFTRESLDRGQLRALCTSPDTAVRPELIELFARQPELLLRQFNLLGVVNGYFTKWGEHAEATQLEKVIVSALDHPVMLSRGRVVKRWREARYLFTAEAANQVAAIILQKTSPASDVWNDLFIGKSTNLAHRSLEQAACRETAVLSKTRGIADGNLVSNVDWLFSKLLVKELDTVIYRECLAELIVSKVPESSSSVRKQLVGSVSNDSRLGDPRLIAATPNWRQMPTRARETFVSWLAEETLQFFFDTIVPRNDENRRRAEFWLRYAKRYGNIKDFQVAVSDEDLTKVRRTPGGNVPTFARVEAPRSSASSTFLMAFEGHGERYIVAEFSETGRAACIYRRSDFEDDGVSLRTQRFDMGDLWNTGLRIDSINHRGDTWERRAAAKLAGYGITA
jgi:hypothetical protein